MALQWGPIVCMSVYVCMGVCVSACLLVHVASPLHTLLSKIPLKQSS